MSFKKYIFFTCLAFLFLFPSVAPAADNDSQENVKGYSLKINGRDVSLLYPPRPVGSEFYLALCDFSVITGCTFEVYPGSGAISIKNGLRYLDLSINSPKAIINDHLANVPAPCEVDGILYIPFKSTAAGLGYSVSSSDSNALSLSYNSYINIKRDSSAESTNDFLPRGAEFITVPASGGQAEKTSYLSSDLDGDGIEEHASFYRENGGRYGLLLFAGKEKSYTRLWQKQELFAPDLLAAGRFDSRRNFLLAGWNLGEPLGSSLEIYSMTESGLDIVYTGLYHKIDIGDFDGDGSDELAIWQQDVGETYNISVLKWNGSRFDHLESCPGYFEKIMDYYNLLPKGTSPARALLFRKAEVSMRAVKPDLAIKYSYDGMYLPQDYPENQIFQGLRGIAMVSLKKYDEALPLLKAALGDQSGTVWPEARLALARCYLETGATGRGLLELGRSVSVGNDWAGFASACQLLAEQRQMSFVAN